ncbi:MAG: hypothetical protein ACTSU2_13735 [Promethearchaeota archaeon]
MEQITNNELDKQKQKLDLLFYLILAVSFAVSFFVRNLIPFFATFLILLVLNAILNRQRNKKRPAREEKELSEFEKRVMEFNKRSRKVGGILSALVITAFIMSLMMDEAMYITFALVILTFIVAYYFYNKEKTELADVPIELKSFKRYEWVDQYRGMVVIFLIIAAGTWILSGGHNNYVGDPNDPPIGPTYLNHGWKFAEFPGWPNIITIIDIGQQILMFIVGYVGALAYYKHREKEGELGAILHVIRRFLALMIFAMIVEGELMDGDLDLNNWNMVSVFWTSTFPNLAWGSLFALLLVAVMKRKPDQRAIIAVIIMTVHAILYAIPSLQTWNITLGTWKVFEVPWNTINHVAIAIMGTCTFDWYMLKKPDDENYGWKKRILPAGTLAFIGVWLVDFLQPAEHHDATTALSLMAIATSMFILYMFYAFDQIDFHVPWLSDLGKNILIMFLFTGIWDAYYHIFTKSFLLQSHLIAMVFVGIIPITIQFMFAWSLARFRIIIKF